MTVDTVFRLFHDEAGCVHCFDDLVRGRQIHACRSGSEIIPAFASVKVLADDGSLVNPSRPMTIGDVMAHTSGLIYHFLEDSPGSQMCEDALILRADVSLSLSLNILPSGIPERTSIRQARLIGERKTREIVDSVGKISIGGLWGPQSHGPPCLSGLGPKGLIVDEPGTIE